MKNGNKGMREYQGKGKKLRMNPTFTEKELFNIIKKIGTRRILRRWCIGRIIPHICLPDRNLVVFIENSSEDIGYQIIDTQAKQLSNYGFNVLRFDEDYIFGNQKAITNEINKLHDSNENRKKFFRLRRAANKSAYR